MNSPGFHYKVLYSHNVPFFSRRKNLAKKCQNTSTATPPKLLLYCHTTFKGEKVGTKCQNIYCSTEGAFGGVEVNRWQMANDLAAFNGLREPPTPSARFLLLSLIYGA